MSSPDPLEPTFADAMVRGWGLVLNCRQCGRVVSLTDLELLKRFAKVAFQPMKRLQGKARCEQCDNRDLLIYPYHSGVTIAWNDDSKAVSDELKRRASRTEQLREWSAAAQEDRAPPNPLNAGGYTAAKRR